MQARHFSRRYQFGTSPPLTPSLTPEWALPVTVHAMLYTPAEAAFIAVLACHRRGGVPPEVPKRQLRVRNKLRALMLFRHPPSRVHPSSASSRGRAAVAGAGGGTMQLAAGAVGVPAQHADTHRRQSGPGQQSAGTTHGKNKWQVAASAVGARPSVALADTVAHAPSGHTGSKGSMRNRIASIGALGMGQLVTVLAAAARLRRGKQSSVKFARAWAQVRLRHVIAMLSVRFVTCAYCCPRDGLQIQRALPTA
jgi:hypothetical protein